MKIAGLVLGIVGIVLSVLLLRAHLEISGGGDASETAAPLGLCGGAGECDQVLESRWAWFPPVKAESASLSASSAEPSEEIVGAADGERRVPVALIGLFYFTALLCWFAISGRVSAEWKWVVRAVCILGTLSSLTYVSLMLMVIRAICPFCMATHIVNFSLLGILWKISGQQARAVGKPTPMLRSMVASLGSPRFAMVSCALIAALCTGEVIAYQAAKIQRQHSAMKEVLSAIQNDVDAMDLIYFAQSKHDVPVRDDSRSGLDAIEFDATIAASDGYRNTVVVFGDAECGSCSRFHEFLFNTVEPRYDGHLRVVYKHLPHDGLHPNSRTAARALEAARQQGKFWELLEELYANQRALHSFDYVAVAERLGLDVASFTKAMSSPRTDERIAEDEALAKALSVTGTPAVFLNGRRVDGKLLRLPGFWNGQIQRLKSSREKAGQGWGSGGNNSTIALGESSD